MRVAWFGHAAGRRADGLSAYSTQTVAALAAAGCEIRFFHHDLDGDRAPVPDVVSLEGVRFKTVTLPLPHTLARIEHALADFRPDVIHCSLSVSLLDGAVARVARGLGAASVVTCHLPYAAEQSTRGRVMRGLYRYHAPHLADYDRVIALSVDQHDLLVHSGVPADRITVMPNAVDTHRTHPGASALKETVGAALLVAYVGRLDPEKRVEELIESFRERRWPADHLLMVAGRGSQQKKLQDLAGTGSAVRLLGMVSDEERLELLQAADIFVLPSTAEGLSLALLEAMAAGCAIIVTDAGEHGPALDGAGVVIPVQPLEPGLGEAMEMLRGDPDMRRRLGEAARRRAVEHYSLDRYIEGMLRLYASAIAARETDRDPAKPAADAGPVRS